MKTLFVITTILFISSASAQTDVDRYFYYAEYYQKQKDYEQAIDWYSKAITLNEKYTEAYHQRGRCRQFSKDYTGAIADYTTAIKLFPHYTKSYLNRAACKNRIGDAKDACEDWKQAEKLASNDSTIYFNQSWYLTIARDSIKKNCGK